MLANTPLPRPTVFGSLGPLALQIHGRQRCPRTGCISSILTWELVYYVLLFLRNAAERGFAGTGTLQLGNREEGAGVRVTLSLREELAMREGKGCVSPGGGSC